MTAPVYYNDNSPFCCAWLRELMADGLIPKGEVDERSITEIQPRELAGFDQWHFFAGSGAWTIALAIAGRANGLSILTGSCPCPPFSVAGRKKLCPSCQEPDLIAHPFRTGFFVCAACGHEWFADGRHLWPEMLRLIRGLNPRIVLGEQVAGEDGEYWLAGVRGSLEMEGFATDAASLNAAGVGANHIRQRLFWGAVRRSDAEHAIGRAEYKINGEEHGRDGSGGGGSIDRHPDPACDGREPRRAEPDGRGAGGGSADGGSSNASGRRRIQQKKERSIQKSERWPGNSGESPWSDFALAPCLSDRRGDASGSRLAERQRAKERPGTIRDERPTASPPSAGAGPWSDFAIAPFGDGKAIRIPKAQPRLQSVVDAGVAACPELADLWDASGGNPLYPLATWPIKGRVGILRGAGNAIIPALAAEFVTAFLEASR